MRRLIALTLILIHGIACAQESPSAELPAPPLQADPANDLFTAGQLAYTEGLEAAKADARRMALGSAVRTFERFLRHFPDDPRSVEARFIIASSQQKLGNAEEAARHFDAVAKSVPFGEFAETAALHLAENYYQSRQYKEAEPYFARIARLTRTDSTRHLALFKRALCLQHLNRSDELKEALRKVVFDKGSPYSERARAAISALYAKEGEKDRAYANYKILAASDDAQIADEAILQSALLARELKRSEEASQWFERIMARPGLKKWHGKAQLTLMTEAYQAGEHGRVIALLGKGNFPLEKNEEAQRVAIAAESHRALGNVAAANELLARLSKIAPDRGQAFDAAYAVLTRQYSSGDRSFVKSARDFLARYGNSHAGDARLDNTRLMLAEKNFAVKNFTEALKLYQVLDLNRMDATNVAGIRYRLAYCHLKLGHPEQARDSFSRFLSNHPDDQRANRALAHRARLQQSLGAQEAALTDYLTLRRTASTPELRLQALTGLAEIYREKKNYAELITLHRLLLKDYPDRAARERAASHFVLAWAHYHQDDFSQAVPHFKKARELNPTGLSQDATLHLVLIAFANQDETTLKPELDRLLRESPSTKLPRPVLAWLGAKESAEGRHEEAWKYLAEVVTPNNPEETRIVVWKAYAKSAEALGKHAESVTAIDYLLPREESPYLRAVLLHRKAKGELALRRFTQAAKTAEAGLELKPQGELNALLRLTFGDIERAQNKLDEALAHYVTVAELIGKGETKRLALNKAIGLYQEKGDATSLAEARRYEDLLKSLD
ncbi:MAG: tetratricopeptide repeat protein [Verrucomicrobiota bacterium JB023]|nr:tetratricopeptide repeat protein [Verrucomicrobiota bacterium JB023]